MALSVRHHGVTDHIVHRVGSGDGHAVVGDLHLQGEVGFVRERDGAPEMMGLWGGAELRWRDHSLTGSGVYEGEVLAMLRSGDGAECDGLIVEGDLPEGDGLKGATAIVTFGDGSTRGCRVRGVDRAGGQTRHSGSSGSPAITMASKSPRTARRRGQPIWGHFVSISPRRDIRTHEVFCGNPNCAFWF